MYTVVSLYPIALNEQKNTLKPPEFPLAASDGEIPSVLVIGDDVTSAYFVADRGKFGEHMDVPVRAEEVANSIVNDFINASMLAKRDLGYHPGLFCVPGSWTAEEIIDRFADQLRAARNAQRRWYWELVKKADDDWTHFKQHKMIAPLQIMAARALGLKREWTTDPLASEMMECPYCLEFVQKRAEICRNCHKPIHEEEAIEA